MMEGAIPPRACGYLDHCRLGGSGGIEMGLPGGGYALPALPDSCLNVQLEKFQSLGARYAAIEMSGLSIALDVDDEIGHQSIDVETEEDSDIIRDGSALGRLAMAEGNASCVVSGGRDAGGCLDAAPGPI